MIYTLLKAFHGASAQAVWSYTSTRMFLAAVTSFLFCLLLGPAFIRVLRRLKVGQSIRVEECPKLGELHAKKQDTPTMGGILILSGMLFSLFLWMDLGHSFTLLLLITTLTLGALGARDDYLKMKYKNAKGVSPRIKLIVQLSLALFISLYLFVPKVSEAFQVGNWFAPPHGKERVKEEMHPLTSKELMTKLSIPFVKRPVQIAAAVGIFLALFVIVGTSNAVNLTDGLDGLAAGCLVAAAAFLSVIAFLSNHSDIAHYLRILYIEGSGEVAVYLAASAGATLAFLWFNAHPAELFMGDTGSLMLGGVLGVSAVLLRRELLLGIVGGIFAIEALSVILQVMSFKLRGGKRIFLCAPIHHHFEYLGIAETKVVIRFWIVALLFGLIALASLKFQ